MTYCTNKKSSQEELNCLCLDYASKEACSLFLVLFWNSVTFPTFHCKPVAVRGWKWGYIIMHEVDLAIKLSLLMLCELSSPHKSKKSKKKKLKKEKIYITVHPTLSLAHWNVLVSWMTIYMSDSVPAHRLVISSHRVRSHHIQWVLLIV